jgi:large subunit ribosomal protein L6
MPVPLPNGVTIEVTPGHVKVTGPKGSLEQDISTDITVEQQDSEVVVTRRTDRGPHRALHGLTRALIANMVHGVSEGYERTLEVQGVGYRASMQGNSLNLQVGYSHPVVVDPPDGITFAVEGTNLIKVSGIDKQLVGQVAADVRAYRKPEPYKGKGIRYQGEQVRRKAGKAGSK